MTAYVQNDHSVRVYGRLWPESNSVRVGGMFVGMVMEDVPDGSLAALIRCGSCPPGACMHVQFCLCCRPWVASDVLASYGLFCHPLCTCSMLLLSATVRRYQAAACHYRISAASWAHCSCVVKGIMMAAAQRLQHAFQQALVDIMSSRHVRSLLPRKQLQAQMTEHVRR